MVPADRREQMGKYDAYLDMEPHKSRRHPPMSNLERAKQFMPFAPLKVYDAALAESRILLAPYRDLSEEEEEDIGRTLNQLYEKLMAGIKPMVMMEVFIPDETRTEQGREFGEYHVISGRLKTIEQSENRLVVDGKTWPISYLSGIWEKEAE